MSHHTTNVFFFVILPRWCFEPNDKKYFFWCKNVTHCLARPCIMNKICHWCLLQYMLREIFLLKWKIYLRISLFFFFFLFSSHLVRKTPFPDTLSPDLEVHIWLWLCQHHLVCTCWHLFTPGVGPPWEAPLHPVAPLLWPQTPMGQLSEASPAVTAQAALGATLGIPTAWLCLSQCWQRAGCQHQGTGAELSTWCRASQHSFKDTWWGWHRPNSVISALMQPVHRLTQSAHIKGHWRLFKAAVTLPLSSI